MSSSSNNSFPHDLSTDRMLKESWGEAFLRILDLDADESLIEKSISEGKFDEIFALYERALDIDSRFSYLDDPASLGKWGDLLHEEVTTSTQIPETIKQVQAVIDALTSTGPRDRESLLKMLEQVKSELQSLIK